MTDNIVSNFECFKHGSTEESIQVSNCNENLKGEKDFENIHENYVPNVKDCVLSTFVTKYNEVRVVPNTSLHHNSILKKNVLDQDTGLQFPNYRGVRGRQSIGWL